MDIEKAKRLVKETFESAFDEDKFRKFVINLFKDNYELERDRELSGKYIPDAYKDFISSYKRILKYKYNDQRIDVLVVNLSREGSLERARTKQRNFISDYLLGNNYLEDALKDAALVAFVSPDKEDWRFSFVRIDFKYDAKRNKMRENASPARRYSFLVGKNEKSHTAQSRFLPLLGDDKIVTLNELEGAFNIEVVTEEFFEAYRYALNEVLIKCLNRNVEYNKKHSFAQLLLSRILFMYFLQRKGFFKWKDYVQDREYIKNLWLRYKEYINKNPNKKDTFYSHWLSSLFFGSFNKKPHLIHNELPKDIQESFKTMPFLNGGLFSKTELDELGFDIPDSIFEWLFEPDPTSNDKKKGFLELFNFTIDESLPLDVEVAVDPEMLGRVYESLIAEEERGYSGIFYTPRVEIDFMCRMALTEFLANKTSIEKEKIIDFIFDPYNRFSIFSRDELGKIKSKLDKVKIVDPAVGSASFLVGMMNILVELHSVLTKQLEGRDENIFALKERVILENLYGVDVKDWAVMVGELRLWLSLIIETDEKYMDIYTKPLLPNFSFKIRQGDSLVEEIGGIQINFRGEQWESYSSVIKDKIQELSEKKSTFYSGQRSADLKEIKEIEKLEHEIFIEILQSKITKIEAEISSLERRIKSLREKRGVFGTIDTNAKKDVEKIENELQDLKEERDKYIAILNDLEKKTKKDYFIWEIDFAEVFAQNGGFDIVIGNPPYVRQELIAPPLASQDNYTDDEWREIKTQYKDKLISSVQAIWKEVRKIDKKSDLYVYFYYNGLSLLKEGGIFCFINSNSWLDVGYGAGLQEFLLKSMRPIYIIDNLKKRSFKQADVNTVIVLIQRPKEKLDDYTIKFVALKKPFEDINNAEVIKRIENTEEPVFDDEDFRLFPKTRKELLLEGIERDEEENNLELNLDPEHLPYIGNKWGGKYLRAPEIYFKILEKGKGKLIRLGDIAEVRFGIKTGANEFFYLKPIGMTVKEVVEITEKNPNTLIPVKNGAEWKGEIEAEFLKPVIKSPRELKTIIVRLEDLNYLVFMCHKSERELRGTKALEYIKYGEKQGFNKRPTCKGRLRWWDLGRWETSKNILPMFENERKYSFYNDANAYIDAALYWCYIKEKVNHEDLNLLLNSTLIGLWKELLCRPPEGLGALQIKVYHYNEIFIPEIRKVKFKKDLFSSFVRGEIPSIFTELGFDPNKPIREQEPNPLPDRKALDDIVFDALDLTKDERKEVYWAVAELVKNRLEKARSV